MKTQTSKRGFAVPKVDVLPRKICLGIVESIVDAKETASGNYNIVGVHIKGIAGSPNAYANILYQPSWLTSEFDESLLNKSEQFVYRRNVITRNRYNTAGNTSTTLSTLAGLCGSEEAFEDLQDRLLSTDSSSMENVTNTLRSYFRDNEGTKIGFILQQKTEKNDEGKYEIVDGYQVGGYFYPGDEAIVEYYKEKATEVNEFGRPILLMGFDTSIPF